MNRYLVERTVPAPADSHPTKYQAIVDTVRRVGAVMAATTPT